MTQGTEAQERGFSQPPGRGHRAALPPPSPRSYRGGGRGGCGGDPSPAASHTPSLFITHLVAQIFFLGLRREGRSSPGVNAPAASQEAVSRGGGGLRERGDTDTVPTCPLLTRVFVRIYPHAPILRSCRCVCTCARDFWGARGRLPGCSLRLSPRYCASPRRGVPGRGCPLRPRRAAGRPRQVGGGEERAPGARRAAGSGAGPLAQPRHRPAAKARPLGAGGGRGGIPPLSQLFPELGSPIRWNYSVLGPKSSPTHAHGRAPAPARKRHLGRPQQLPRQAAPAPTAPPAERGFYRSAPGSDPELPSRFEASWSENTLLPK
ncbi:uncharacterized protein LOC115350248 [Aquila chrysaetos chrysaetos]|uniref:uncharacterized protein LOC115350248 n=1 Tax=Aquila chrysaetos chrysaetos TaxID=223781 RepID=UPI00117681BA|nr:uncharacterized protein LOC115350248 [Aquila chrysaetos chrysaetos]